jgi:EAL domain-containing protein (putative c-di-GMP-specific phosphodiesterase class I)/CheY-like chemotaxis protein
MNQTALDSISLEDDLRQAIRNDSLQLLYQPLVDLQSGQIASLEALVRWQHPVMGLITADRFIPVAEKTGLIDDIGAWVLRRACSDLKAWRDAGHDQLKASINVSPMQFIDEQMAEQITSTLDEFSLPPTCLTLEVRETVGMRDTETREHHLLQLKALGVALALDDFGTGYSSLSYLKRLPFDLVKIDRDFIREITTDVNDAALAKAIISMAHNLGMKVVAEGVETEAQCDFLRKNMCDQIQGYFFSPPLVAIELSKLLDEKRSLPAHLWLVQKPKRSLLLVDDEQNIVSALKRLLRRDDYQIYTANSGQAGLDVLAEHPVDVIVSDHRMPGMIGADFLRTAKDLYPSTIRIMLSGYTELQSVTDAVNTGAIYKFLTKPWDDDLLRGHIADAFRLKEIADDNERLNLEVRNANHDLAAANRKMEELLRQNEQQIAHDEISLNVVREVLQFLPLPVIGLDDEGMVAFINAEAETLFKTSGMLLGNEATEVLPALFPPLDAPPSKQHQAQIDGAWFSVAIHPMGLNSESRGGLITLNRCEKQL